MQKFHKSKGLALLLIGIVLIVIGIGVLIMRKNNEVQTDETKSNLETKKTDQKEAILTQPPVKDSDVTVNPQKLEEMTRLLNAQGVTDSAIIAQVAAMPELADSTESTQEMKYPTLTYIGHASVKLKSIEGDVIYIDPYYEGDYSEPANYILVTHEHSDHNDVSKCTQADGCQVIHYKDALIDGEYKTFENDHIRIEAVPSGDNHNHALALNVGYIVTMDGVSVFHAGDTSMSEGKKVIAEKKIDYAMYPVDGIYNMGPEEATEVADLIGATHNIPIHGNGKKLLQQVLEFSPKGKLVVMFGQTIDLK